MKGKVRLFPERKTVGEKKKVSESCKGKIRKLVELNFTSGDRNHLRDHINDHADHKQHG